MKLHINTNVKPVAQPHRHRHAEDDSNLKMDSDDATDLVVMDINVQTSNPDVSLSLRAEPTRPRRDRHPPVKFKDYEHYKLPK